jgi:L-fucose isomerase-like protein
MDNIPEVKVGLVAVSRDCFPAELCRQRRGRVAEACRSRALPVTELSTLVENEHDVLAALEEARRAGVNALVLYLGNFGPEGPISNLAQRFDGPVMLVAAAEESGSDLIGGRGDAYCGLLSATYNVGLRSLRVHLPHYPVGSADEIAGMIEHFTPVARGVIALRDLKIITFGPRPHDFLACNAPIKPLYDLGVEVMENSELDLFDLFEETKGHPDIPKVAAEMAAELGSGNNYPDLLETLARYEVALLRFREENLGASRYAVFANKCWPAFEKYFGCTPCFINSRLAARGIPVACETDIYGALSEYLGSCVTMDPVTLLDINNTVPADLVGDLPEGLQLTDLFMGFHCGNTPGACLTDAQLKYQLIMHRMMEPDQEPTITRGTLEGDLRPGAVTVYRLQATADAELRAYVTEGEVLDLPTKSFGSIGIFAIREMARFYRYALLQKCFPHHTAVAFGHAGRAIFDLYRMLGIDDISWNRPAGLPYPNENPF